MASTSYPINLSRPQAPQRKRRVTPVPVLLSLPSATHYFGTASLDTLICKACMLSTPTMSSLAQH
jgi:hypothetical protein